MVVRREEADEEAGDLRVRRLGQPGRSGEVLQPQARQQLGEVPSAPPVVDHADDRNVVVLGRASERDVRERLGIGWHQLWTGPLLAPHHAVTAAIMASAGTNGPNVASW